MSPLIAVNEQQLRVNFLQRIFFVFFLFIFIYSADSLNIIEHEHETTKYCWMSNVERQVENVCLAILIVFTIPLLSLSKH